MCRDKHNSAVQWTEERLRAKSTKGASCRSDPNAVQSDNPLLIHAELNAEKGQVREELLNRNEGNGMNVWMNAYCGRVTEVGKTKRRQSTYCEQAGVVLPRRSSERSRTAPRSYEMLHVPPSEEAQDHLEDSDTSLSCTYSSACVRGTNVNVFGWLACAAVVWWSRKRETL